MNGLLKIPFLDKNYFNKEENLANENWQNIAYTNR